MIELTVQEQEKNLGLPSENDVLETGGGLNRTAGLGFTNEQNLLETIRGKRVLDLGSGSGGFAKQVYEKLGNSTLVVSLNPRLFFDAYRQHHSKIDALQQERGVLTKKKTFLKEINQLYRSSAVAASWDNLPFARESFDYIFATGSYLFYLDTHRPKVLRRILELLKKGGEFRVEVLIPFHYQLEEAIEQAKAANYEVTAEHQATPNGLAYVIFKKPA